ncbi:DNA polymerase IV [Fusibacter sp. A1]|uniref:DNA polymerase IV n=2 Tax=unclassified Fusibacter TaxID=2624464 RepID=UPI0013E995EA|nr:MULTISPECIES: DNA polymerase IV [unclassified Fusibacter]NPE20872.1 DNA polymerase IV [Fusibacter sp. A1]
MRKIIHMDMDAFFAAVEQLDHPEYRGKPVIVGGVGERGVVATASYEARKFGIHSAMPGFRAKKLCPNGIFVRGSYERYTELSKQVFDILSRYTDHIEQVSIDEAYLDVSDVEDAYALACAMKHAIIMETGLTASFGVSYNKFLAKLGSDWNKPNGIKVINEEDVPEILKPLPIRKVHGLGKKSVERLNRIGIFTIEDLLIYDESFLTEFIGGFGKAIYWRIRGVDDRPVGEMTKRKSYGKETTFSEDILEEPVLIEQLQRFSLKIASYLSRKSLVANTVTLKYKTFDFQSHTRSKTVYNYIRTCEELMAVAMDLLKSEPIDKPIRLIGLTVSNLEPEDQVQISLLD